MTAISERAETRCGACAYLAGVCVDRKVVYLDFEQAAAIPPPAAAPLPGPHRQQVLLRMAHAGVAAMARRREAAVAARMVVPTFPCSPVAFAVPVCVGQVVAPQPAAQGAVGMVVRMMVVALGCVVPWKTHRICDQRKGVAVEAVGCCLRLLRGEDERRDHVAGPRPECRRR